MQLKLLDIRLGIKIKKDPDSGLFIVVSVFEGFSGSKGGIKAGDKIISIDAKSTRGMEVWEVTSLIRGEIGTSVNLGISRDGNIINKVFLREEFSNKQKAKVGSKKINCDSPVWKNKPRCN